MMTKGRRGIREIVLRRPRLHQSQQRVRDSARRFNILACGRRWGKTLLGIEMVIDVLLAGEPVGWFGPSYKFLADTWRALKDRLADVTIERSEAEHRLKIYRGGVVEMWSLDNPDAGRGRYYKRVVVDEAALVPNLEAAWNGSIRPTLTDLRGDAWLLSTPKGHNYFWQLFRRGQDKAWGDEWVSWQLPTASNPYIAPEEIEAAKRMLPERIFAQEYLAEFLDEGAGVFRKVTEAAVAQWQERPLGGHEYLVSVDWGKYNDFTAIIVWDITARSMAYLERFNQIDYALQLSRLRGVCERFKPVALVPERNSVGDALIELIAREAWAPRQIIPFVTTAISKTAAVEAFALALERGEVKILPDPDLISELMAFEAVRLPGGGLRYSAPEGAHDDLVIATIIGWYVIAAGPETERIIYDDPVRISLV